MGQWPPLPDDALRNALLSPLKSLRPPDWVDPVMTPADENQLRDALMATPDRLGVARQAGIVSDEGLRNMAHMVIPGIGKKRSMGEFTPYEIKNAGMEPEEPSILGMPMSQGAAYTGIFAGPKALTADLGALKRAEELEVGGAFPDEVWEQTGWGRGADNKWRFEIPDDRMTHSLNSKFAGPETGATVGTVVDHPELFAAYPELLNYGVGLDHGVGGALSGDFITVGRLGGAEKTKATLLHELQHGVQGAEGFATGGNPHFLKPGTPAWDIYQERLAAMHTPLSREEFSRQAGYDGPAPEKDYKDYLKSTRNISPLADRMAQEYAAQEAYRRLAGEVEARNVSKRMNMTPQERRDMPPGFTEDVSRDQQLLRFRTPGAVEKSDSVGGMFDFSNPGGGSRTAQIGDTEITYGVGNDGSAEVILVKTPKDKRGQGSARAAMERMIAEADANGLRLKLSADPMDRGVSKSRLVAFYKSLGFKRNAGRYRDFTTRAEFIREPVKPQN